MMNNLYPVKKLTTINNARAIFLMELKEKTFIDISSHIFDTIIDETRTTSRAKLVFPSLLTRTFRAKGVPIPQNLSLMPTPSAINKQTIIWIQVRLLGDVDEEGAEQEEGDPMDTEVEAAGQSSNPEAKQRGTGLLPHQLHLQMHSRSSWKGLMASERFKISKLKG